MQLILLLAQLAKASGSNHTVDGTQIHLRAGNQGDHIKTPPKISPEYFEVPKFEKFDTTKPFAKQRQIIENAIIILHNQWYFKLDKEIYEAHDIADFFFCNYSKGIKFYAEGPIDTFSGPTKLFKKIQKTEFKAPYNGVIPESLRSKFELLDDYLKKFSTNVAGLKKDVSAIYAHAYAYAINPALGIEATMINYGATDLVKKFKENRERLFESFKNTSKFLEETAEKITDNQTTDDLFSNILNKKFADEIYNKAYIIESHYIYYLFESIDAFRKILEHKNEDLSQLDINIEPLHRHLYLMCAVKDYFYNLPACKNPDGRLRYYISCFWRRTYIDEKTLEKAIMKLIVGIWCVAMPDKYNAYADLQKAISAENFE